MILTKQDLANKEKLFRINVINKVSGIKSAHLIATKSKEGNTNLAIFNSVIHIGANPGLVGFIMRPVHIERHTYTHISENKFYTLNAITAAMAERAHQTSAKYNKGESEFDHCKFSASYINDFYPPFVEESPIKIAVKLVEELEIKSNNTKLMIGEIQFIELKEGVIDASGNINFDQLNLVGIGGLDSYYDLKFKTTLPFARP